MPTRKTALVLHAAAGRSRGGTADLAAIDSDRKAINDAAEGFFTLDTVEAFELGTARAAGEPVTRELADDDVIEVELVDGGRLWISVARLRELTAQSGDRLELAADTRLAPDSGTSRGVADWIRRVLIPKITWKGGLEDTAKTLVVRAAIKKIESQLIGGESGVHEMSFADVGGATFEALAAAPEVEDRPFLVFLHGTASSTNGSFAHLWGGKVEAAGAGSTTERRKAWLRAIGSGAEARYARILALEHCTLSESPARNACTLLEKLPAGQRIHVISHSRGGLVGELLCRGAVSGRLEPITDGDIDLYLSAYADDALRTDTQKELKRLNALLREKRPRVERFVRVGCPSRGTTLAAKRLDIYLNLILSAIQVGGVQLLGPTAGALLGHLKALTIAVARSRLDHSQLPGLHAQVPDGGLARLINDSRVQVDADLTVIAGNAEAGQGLKQTLLVALTNLYYWQANDWVVETDAMIGGHPRQTPGCFFLDDGSRQGEAVNHFSYFKNDRTFNAIVQALAGHHRELPDFLSLAAEPVKTKSRGETDVRPKCITVMLPGLPGSHLSEDGDRIWLHPLRIAMGELDRINVRKPENQVSPDGWFRSRYQELADYLGEQGHRVVVFDYDWRLSLPANSRRLGEKMQALSREAENGKLPVRILAHSMGGWVSLHWLANDNQGLWDKLCRHHDARLVIAGTPLKGTFDSIQLLTANHPMLTMLAAADFEHDSYDLIDQLRHYPGLLETFPGDAIAGTDWNFFDDRHWDRLKPVLHKRWKRPNADALHKAFGVRGQVDVDNPPPHSGRVLYLAGQDNATPCGIAVAGGALVFDYTAAGDGLTTWASIPAWLKEHQCWYLRQVKHGDLLRADDAFPAIRDLMESGDTPSLPRLAPPTARGAPAAPDVGPDTPVLFPTPEDIEAAALHGSPVRRGLRPPALPKCQVRIRHGNLNYADVPVMVGHYDGDSIEGSEAALDAMLGGRLKALHRANLYPGPLDTVEILTRPGTRRTAGAVVAGLGPVGRLSAFTLQQTLRHALIRFGLDQAEKSRREDASQDQHDATLAIASLVVGSGVGGLTLADAVKALLEAVTGANSQLRELDAPQLQRLDILELFEDQAIAIAHACARVSKEMDTAFAFDLSIRPMQGGLARPFFAEQTPWWRRVQITSQGDGRLDFAPLTDKAAIDVQAHSTQTALIDAMLADATATTSDNSAIAQSLFELLIPNPLKAQVEAQGGMVMLVDDAAAKYPWELLSNRRSRDPRPLATRIGLIRQLYDRSGEQPRPAVRNRKALVVGDTQAGPGFPELPGAVAEAATVCECLNRAGYDSGQPLIRRKGVDIVMTLTNADYQIVHLAGHGVVGYPMIDPRTGKPEDKTGMVLGDGIVLGSGEIKALGRIPELVFINCCHLGANSEPPSGGPRHELAANLGTAFIRAGVKCVVAAGWAVDDAAAALFAETFYDLMLSGAAFGDAVTRARKAVFDKHPATNTWGAYQCYGDYGFTLTLQEQREQPAKSRYYGPREIEIEAANIRSKAHTARLEPGDASASALLDRLSNIETQISEKAHLKTAAVCAAIGGAYHELGAFKESVHWSEQALKCEDGGITVKALENRANALARLAEQGATELVVGETPDAALQRMRSADETAENAIALTTTLVELGTTGERSNILASARKHHGFINAVLTATGTSQRERRSAGRKARDSLFAAYGLYLTQSDKTLADIGKLDSYPLLNAAALWLYLSRQEGLPQKIRDGLQSSASVRNELDRLARQFDTLPPAEGAQRFWDRTDRINLALYRALVDRNLHESGNSPLWQELAAQYKEEFRLASDRERDSVTKQLRILSTLLGTGEPSLKALGRLSKEIAVEAEDD